MSKLILQMFGGLVGILAGMALLLFLPAGTVDYWQAWAVLAVWGVSSAVVGVYLIRRDPELLRRRMRGGPIAEPHGSQKVIMSFAVLAFVALFPIAGLDRRWGWTAVPVAVCIAGDILLALGWAATHLVFRRTRSPRRRCRSAPASVSSRRDRMAWCGTRCTWDRSSTS